MKSLKDNFLAEPKKADFSESEEVRTEINNWVEEQTDSKIKDLIGDGVLGSNTKMVLVNAIYFKGEWETKFLERNTFRYQFQISNNETADVDMMYNSGEYAHIYIPELKAVFLNLGVIYTSTCISLTYIPVFSFHI